MDEDADSFATIEWIRLLATYAAIHVAIHGLSRLKCLFRSEHVDSHVPDMTTPARGGSSRDRQANAPIKPNNIAAGAASASNTSTTRNDM